MRLLIGFLSCFSVGAASQALADQPPSTPAAATATAPTVTVTGRRDPDERLLISAGYRAEIHNGEKVFCRWEDETGSRLDRKRVCGSVEQIKWAVRENQDRLSESLRHQHNAAH
jgi:hypothetical protein